MTAKELEDNPYGQGVPIVRVARKYGLVDEYGRFTPPPPGTTPDEFMRAASRPPAPSAERAPALPDDRAVLLGRRIRMYRVFRGLRLDDLAEPVGLSRSALSRIENGARRLSALELERLASYLEIGPGELLGPPAAIGRDR